MKNWTRGYVTTETFVLLEKNLFDSLQVYSNGEYIFKRISKLVQLGCFFQ